MTPLADDLSLHTLQHDPAFIDYGVDDETGDRVYAVNDVYLSVQGEGTHTGVPMVIVRLHGCPVGCPFCDTKETWHADPALLRSPGLPDWRGTNPRWTLMQAFALAELARSLSGTCEWILLTGGEPALQPLRELALAFHSFGFNIAIETSGTALGFIGANIDHICVSPKIGMPGGRTIQQDAVAHADEIKWVVGKEADLEALRLFLLAYDVRVSSVAIPGVGVVGVSVQPMSASKRATELCLAAALEHGYRVSIQVHKLLEVR